MELYDLYQEPQIVGVIKSSRLRWAGHIERSEENSLLSRIIGVIQEGRDVLEGPGRNGSRM